MKINTIGAYLLVYLLARGHWNLMVPVRADEESDGTTGSASADAGSAGNGAAEATPLTGSAAPEGSSSETYAGLTSADGSANGATTDAGSALTSEAAEGSADAGHVAGESADAGSSGEAGEARTGAVELGSLYPDFFTGGTSADEAPMIKPELEAKRNETLLLAEKARKAAEDLRKAAEKLSKEADVLTKAVEDNVKLEDNVKMSALSARLDAFDQNVGVELKRADDIGKDLDMTYYSGFPNGWHSRGHGAIEQLTEREKKVGDYMLYYGGFPNGWHRQDEGAEEQFVVREKKWLNNIEYYNGFPDGWHFGNPLVLRDIRRHELKGEIAAKKKEIESLNNVILDLTTQMQAIEADVVKLEQEHNDLVQKLLGFDALLIKLYKADAEGNSVLMEENTDFEKKKSQGDLRFVFKEGAMCTLVKYGDHELWKKGEREVDVPKLVAFNDTVGVLAVRDENRAVLYKKDTNSDKWIYHNTILRKTAGSTGSRSTTQTVSPAQSGTTSTLASSSALAGSKMNLEAGSTGTPETPESLDETASVASGEGSESNEANEADSGTALRGSTVGSAGLASEGSTDGGSSGEGYAGLASEGSTDGGSSAGGSSGQGISSGDYSSVFMD